MINKTYLHPVRTSDYSNSISSCHVLTSHPPSNKISPYSILEVTLLNSRIFYPPLHSPQIFKLPSTGDKEICEKSLFPNQSSI